MPLGSSALSFFGGFILGLALLGSATYRTISTYDGNVVLAVKSSIAVSITYWFSLQYVIDGNAFGYFGFAIGEAVVVSILANRRKKTQLTLKEKSVLGE